MKEKVERAKQLISDALRKYDKVSVACSFGKDSMVVAHIAQEIKPDIPMFSVMTIFKPKETYKYLAKMTERMKLNLTIYMVADKIPSEFVDQGVVLLPMDEFKHHNLTVMNVNFGRRLYEIDPDKCCELLKVVPTKMAVKNLDAWICGLRNTEGRTRVDYQEVEEKGRLIKVNPILTFTEDEVWQYIRECDIEPHPWYAKGYRSLGCAPCSSKGGIMERDGRWKGTSKCSGECGIHTQVLK